MRRHRPLLLALLLGSAASAAAEAAKASAGPVEAVASPASLEEEAHVEARALRERVRELEAYAVHNLENQCLEQLAMATPAPPT